MPKCNVTKCVWYSEKRSARCEAYQEVVTCKAYKKFNQEEEREKKKANIEEKYLALTHAVNNAVKFGEDVSLKSLLEFLQNTLNELKD